MTGDQADDILQITSIYGALTGEAYVDLRWGEKRAQLTVPEARLHALRILEVCAGAETDAILVRWAREKLGADEQVVAGILTDFRDMRG